FAPCRFRSSSPTRRRRRSDDLLRRNARRPPRRLARSRRRRRGRPRARRRRGRRCLVAEGATMMIDEIEARMAALVRKIGDDEKALAALADEWLSIGEKLFSAGEAIGRAAASRDERFQAVLEEYRRRSARYLALLEEQGGRR